MHVVLISLCQKKAWKKSRAILDSYALRSGERTWMTPLTMEGLSELRSAIRKQATRQTSVACFRNIGRSRMALLWIVGNRKGFSKNGLTPVAIQTQKEKRSFPKWARIASLLAESAGLMHDLGKFGTAFQDKLKKPEPTADPVRHEWLSMILVREWLAKESLPETHDTWESLWLETWKSIGKLPEHDRYSCGAPFDASIKTPSEALLFLIATHHRLPSGETGRIDNKNHVRDESHIPKPISVPETETFQKIRQKLEKVKRSSQQAGDDPMYWKTLIWIARAALILADHSVSSLEPEVSEMPLVGKDTVAYANTKKNGNKRESNQELNWHLGHVGQEASRMMFRMLSLSPPSLSEESVRKIQEPSTDKRYRWQNIASQAISNSAKKNQSPHIIFNMAGTGSGKTRMNARAICSLKEESGDVRFTTALNLRTLTLQTGDAYRHQIGIGEDELACVIGDSLTQKLFAIGKKSDPVLTENIIDDDENQPEEDLETVSGFEWSDQPEWIRVFFKNKAKTESVIGSPVLVSTIDFLVDAGDPARQGNHAMAMLRIMTSDLILDEIDSYDPDPMMAVLRLVWLSGVFGRNVVVSSATLSRPVARMIWRSYSSGIRAKGLLENEKTSFVSMLVDDLSGPSRIVCDREEVFMEGYEKHLDGMWSKMGQQTYRKSVLLKVERNGREKDTAPIKKSVIEGLKSLHEKNHIVDGKTGKKISFGLIRMANIRPAIEMASHVSEKMSESVRVACYHSQHPLIVRWKIECSLDVLLNRKNGDNHIFLDPGIREILDQSKKENILFVVVATPVEEIGRDHDFDWAIIEPSSTQSIVQTAGRVNRHRLQIVQEANIGILQYNLKEMEGQKVVFHRPGLETEGSHNGEHDLEKLLDWGWLKENPLDARLRFDQRHRFGILDDKSLSALSNNNIEIITEASSFTSGGKEKLDWMSKGFYNKTSLRQKNQNIQFYLPDPVDEPRKIIVEPEKTDHTITLTNLHRKNSWLTVSGENMLEMVDELGITKEKGLSVRITGNRLENIQRDCDFGFFRKAH